MIPQDLQLRDIRLVDVLLEVLDLPYLDELASAAGGDHIVIVCDVEGVHALVVVLARAPVPSCPHQDVGHQVEAGPSRHVQQAELTLAVPEDHVTRQ